MDDTTNTSGFAISIYSEFDPVAFQPNWLFHHKIEKNSLRDFVKLRSIGPYISEFSVADTFYKIEQSRFDLNTINNDPQSVVEKITKIANTIPHKEVQRISIDRYIYCKSHTEEERKQLLENLLPLNKWGSFGKEMKQGSSIYVTGLYNLTLFSNESSKNKDVLKRFFIEPISEVGQRTGLFAVVNFGITIIKNGEKLLLKDYSKLIENEYQNRIAEADEIFQTVFKL